MKSKLEKKTVREQVTLAGGPSKVAGEIGDVSPENVIYWCNIDAVPRWRLNAFRTAIKRLTDDPGQ